ncbi:acyl-CoA dehydrogenase family protein [Fimbriiglobus ruber]|uniref:Acyl-CoA dehydrogenase n=1 Tax=Fimbriiglobus ruber TaxID=1908690 RepID=A0A225DFQ3_9BACT|nr:acyl-CoA dehydrogenase family protein [Fimbriiglobus ruber]OWK38474.1 acyl-CoA dehydrogenase [Fimbriiglobus ruber]
MALTATQIAEQKKQVEELIAGPDQLGFAKALFYGRVREDLLFPYPALPPDQQHAADEAAARVRDYADRHIDHMKIDREAQIPDEVVRGLGDLGVLGMTAPPAFGGLGFNQRQYLKVMEILGGHCSSTAVFVNAHHSIGIRALLLFGTKEQQEKWLPDLVAGRKLAAFALTEEQAGSDAGNVQTKAELTPDGSAYILNGGKRYITNGGIADVLTVMARTPAADGSSKVTAFLVTPDLRGFEVLETRAEKCGIRGTATGKLKFTDMRVPKENVLGSVGKGLKVALTVLDFGRTTFGASCTGHAKACVKAMVKHSKSRVQFQQPLAEFEMVQKKIAFAAAHAFAMEAATAECAGLIDGGSDDYMVETAMLKVFATEHLWPIVNDTIQVFGGKAYFSDQPYERWMRDARINTIGEGANDVLKAFIAVVGCRAPGEYLKGLRDDVMGGRWSIGKLGAALGVGAKLVTPWAAHTPHVPASHPELFDEARHLAKMVKHFGTTLPHVFMRLKDEAAFVQAELIHERIADIAIDLFVSACVIARLDHLLGKPASNGHAAAPDPFADAAAGHYFLKCAFRRIDERFAGLEHNDDADCVAVARGMLGKW